MNRYSNLLLKQKNIFKIGVTGGIGSGKTTVCDMFARLGVPVLHSDEMAKELSTSNPVVRKKLLTLLGESVYLSDGSFNRPFVASKIFSDKGLQKKVEAIIHPQVEKERDRRISELKKQGHRLLLIEAALIYEAEMDKNLDAVIVVASDEAVRMMRVRKRDAVTEESVRARMNAQLEVKKKLDKADYVIYNDGTLDELESRVKFLHTLFVKLIDEDARG